MTVLLNPKSSKIVENRRKLADLFLHMILVVYLGHGIFRPPVAVLFLSKVMFLG